MGAMLSQMVHLVQHRMEAMLSQMVHLVQHRMEAMLSYQCIVFCLLFDAIMFLLILRLRTFKVKVLP